MARRKYDRNVFVAAEGVVGGDDDAGLPEETARADPVARFDANGGVAGVFHKVGQVSGKTAEDMFHDPIMTDSARLPHRPFGQAKPGNWCRYALAKSRREFGRFSGSFRGLPPGDSPGCR